MLDPKQLRAWAYFSQASGLVAFVLGFLALNGLAPASLGGRQEAILGLVVGGVTFFLGRKAVKTLDKHGF